MNYMVQAISWLKHFVRQHLYVSIAIGVLCLGLLGGAIAFATTGSTAKTATAAASTKTATAVKAASTTSDQKTDNGQPAAAATTAATPATPKATVPKPAAPANQHWFIISPSSITVKAGEAYSVISVKTDDGQAVAMPMFLGGPAGLMANFPAAPFRTTWNGSIMTMRTMQPGTYTAQLSAQAQTNSKVWYSGTLTVTILPTATATVAVQQTGYDAPSDTLLFSLQLIRKNGFSQPVTTWYASNPEHTLECAFYQNGADSYDVDCYNPNGPTPTSGKLMATISTTSDSFAGEVLFSR